MNTFIKTTMRPLTLLAFVSSGAVIANEVPAHVMADYQAGVQGDAAANARAIHALSELQQQQPKDALTIGLLGSSQTAGARYADQPWEKMQLSEKGLAKLDKSLILVNKQPTDAASAAVHMQIHVTAGCTFISVPPMFNRFDQGYRLLETAINSAGFSQSPARAQLKAYLCAAQAAVQHGDQQKAANYLHHIVTLAPQGPHLAMVEQLKAELAKAITEE